MERIKYLAAPLLLLLLWAAGSKFAGTVLFPSPEQVIPRLAEIFTDYRLASNIAVTLFRGVLSLLIVYSVSLPAGVVCGLSRSFMDMISPLVTMSQSAPPVIWIALLMIWTGIGSTVPVVVAVITMLPVVFFSTATAVSSIERDYISVAKVYRIRKRDIVSGIIIPAIYPSVAGSLSYSLGVVWKVVATAEFFGSGDGIGARLYSSFRMLDTPALFAWAIVIVALGFLIDTVLIRSIGKKVLSYGGGS